MAESDYSVRLNNLTLPGTLLLPKSNNKHILVIFIHGSGPQDRDESYNGNRPFKNIADGLLKYGIASYRFDKRTKIAPLLFINDDYTVDDEVCNDVIGLISYFHNNDTFKSYKIVLVGHSLGAMLIPKIVNSSHNQVGAAVMIAAPARPTQDVLLDQVKYLDSLQDSVNLNIDVGELSTQVRYLESDSFNLKSPKVKLPGNLPASYWMSLMAYDQVAIAKKISVPLLVIQGEHDYQVTMKDFELWKKNLKDNKNVEFKSYSKLTHFLFETKNMSVPSDYDKKWCVAQYLIKDMAKWILQIK